MSHKQDTVIIEPGKYGISPETIVFRGYRCPRCGGKGGFTEQTGRDTFETEVCLFCLGSKKVKATVIIKWEADFMMIKEGLKFKNRHFSGIFTIIAIENGETKGSVVVECQSPGSTWKEVWDYQTTLWGFELGEYQAVKKQNDFQI